MSHFATQSDNSQQAERRTTASSFNQHGVNKRPLLIDDYVSSTVRKVSDNCWINIDRSEEQKSWGERNVC
jgi:hypothetical protein